MITKDSTGATLPQTFLDRMGEKYLNSHRAPKWELLFCRKISSTWYTRNVTKLWLSSNPYTVSLPDKFGLAEQGTAEFLFDNTPLTYLASDYTSGTTLTVEPRLLVFDLLVTDWISIANHDNIEYKRVTGVTKTNDAITGITIHSALTNTYSAGETEIRFAFAIHPTETALDTNQKDLYIGTMMCKFGFQDMRPMITLFQGEVVKGIESPDRQVVIQCESPAEKIRRQHALTRDIEMDDRGLASQPLPAAANTGDGDISRISYHTFKDPAQLTTENWTLTCKTAAQDKDGNTVTGWTLSGSVSGTVAVDGPLPNHEDEDAWLPTGEFGNWKWDIDTRGIGGRGFALTITEGATAFANNDKFYFYTHALGPNVINIGNEDPLTNPLKVLSERNVSTVIDEILGGILGFQHENPETGATTGILDPDNQTAVRLAAPDEYLQRGRFEEGTSLSDVFSQLLRLPMGWLYPTHDGHLAIFYYDDSFLEFGSDITLSDNPNDMTRDFNVMEANSVSVDIGKIKNRIILRHNLSDEAIEIILDDTGSQSEFGFALRNELYADQLLANEVSSNLAYTVNDINSYEINYFSRYANPLKEFDLSLIPHGLLLEVGDIGLLYSQRLHYSGRVWFPVVTKQLKALTVQVKAEENTTAEA